MTAHVYLSSLISYFFPRSQSWADCLLYFKVSLWLSFCSFPLPVDHSPGTGTLNVSVSREVPALCPRCHVWRVFYSGDPFSLILIPCAHFPCHRSFHFTLVRIVELKWLCLAGHFLLGHPLLTQAEDLPLDKYIPRAAASLRLWGPPLPASSALLCWLHGYQSQYPYLPLDGSMSLPLPWG